MMEKVISKRQKKLELDKEGRRALAQVYRLLLRLAEEADKEPSNTSTAETDLEEAQ